MNLILKQSVLFLVSLIMVLSTVFVLSAPVMDEASFSRVSFGYPFSFLSQDLSSIEGLHFFPSYHRLSLSFKEHPVTGFSVSHFSADLLLIFGGIEAIIFILEKLKAIVFQRGKKSEPIVY